MHVAIAAIIFQLAIVILTPQTTRMDDSGSPAMPRRRPLATETAEQHQGVPQWMMSDPSAAAATREMVY